MRIVSAEKSIFNCSLEAKRSIRCLRVMNLSEAKKSFPLIVFVNGSGISKNCVVGMLGVNARRALLTALAVDGTIQISNKQDNPFHLLISRSLGKTAIVAAVNMAFEHSSS